MPELIDKGKLLHYLKAIKPDEYVSAYGEAAVDKIVKEMLDEIEAMPIVHIDDMAFNIQNKIQAKKPSRTVEITFVRHGRWIEQESPYGRHYNCSECGHEVCVPCSEMIDPRDHVCYLDDYCGKCGTRMDSTDTNVDDKGGVDNDT